MHLEHRAGSTRLIETDGQSFRALSDLREWSTQEHLDDPDGQRLLEEASRRLRDIERTTGAKAEGIAVAMPGTIRDYSVVARSTRLGMMQRRDVGEYFRKTHALPAYVFSDTHAHAYGEMAVNEIDEERVGGTFAFVLVDEGVGMSLFIDGKLQTGAGSAGALGRLIVEPAGEFHERYAARGALETYVSRPWVSRRIVTAYLGELDKRRAPDEEVSDVQRRLKVAAENKLWESLDLKTIGEAAESGDRIVLSVLDEAAQYVGLALNAIITIVNPPFIMLSGAMMCNIPGQSDAAIAYARNFSWGETWNKTQILKSSFHEETLGLGAASLFARLDDGRLL